MSMPSPNPQVPSRPVLVPYFCFVNISSCSAILALSLAILESSLTLPHQVLTLVWFSTLTAPHQSLCLDLLVPSLPNDLLLPFSQLHPSHPTDHWQRSLLQYQVCVCFHLTPEEYPVDTAYRMKFKFKLIHNQTPGYCSSLMSYNSSSWTPYSIYTNGIGFPQHILVSLTLPFLPLGISFPQLHMSRF